MMKNIKGYEIYIEGTWCEVTKEGNFIYEGSVSEDMTHEDIYICITAEIVFKLNDKVLLRYNALNEVFVEREITKEQLAFENNCSTKYIKIVKELGNIA